MLSVALVLGDSRCKTASVNLSFFHSASLAPGKYKGQITFFSMEVLEALRQELNLPAAQPQATRRTAFVRGEDLNALIGQEFEIQGRHLAGIEDSKPCHWMDSALGPGAKEWLKGRVGLCCRILTDGILRRDC
jgi:MOSC domain-containing protein YiiM